MQGRNTTEVIAWNKHSVRTTNQEESNILIEENKRQQRYCTLFYSRKNVDNLNTRMERVKFGLFQSNSEFT